MSEQPTPNLTTLKKRAGVISRTLKRLYPTTPIPLDHHSAYTLLVAVLLSAQCTDKRVNQVTPMLFQLADDAFKMAKIPTDKIKAIIRPCGLSPKKSAAIKKLSQILVEKYHGEVPRTEKELEALPGVGHKTASVVLAQAFGIPTFPVDTHIHRLAVRWQLSSGRNVVQTERDLKKLFPKTQWNNLHLQMIFFGREYCPARGHIISECPLCKKFQ